MSASKYLLYALVYCLVSHGLKWPVGVVFIGPNTKLAVGEKLVLSVVHRTVRCPYPVRLAVGSDNDGDRWRYRLLHRIVQTLHQTVQWLLSTSATWN
jgi:hypothetical protein